MPYAQMVQVSVRRLAVLPQYSSVIVRWCGVNNNVSHVFDNHLDGENSLMAISGYYVSAFLDVRLGSTDEACNGDPDFFSAARFRLAENNGVQLVPTSNIRFERSDFM